ncbi:DUF1624 domain-containing protein [Acuticoccus kandeliae]|uniref:DUF1624 domain-containing protein n=1 Tax=Acuticoccus kandeliae TaxID=2073160 RepID=UPI00130031C6|nr:heparan-alpha-glucosaminide N-acetyltransferase [Acuticoccus kandeliae]
MAILTRRAGPRRPRILWLDAARGLAIIAMVIYHGAFDLLFFGYVDWPVSYGTGWRTFAASIASTFLFLVGVSLVVAHGAGIRWRSFLIRFLVIAGAAALVTIGTAFAMPVPIYFGILHAIATFSVLALPFLRLPAWITLAVAAFVLVLPNLYSSPIFDGPFFYALGLAETGPFAFDYEPIFPWFSATLFGVAFARLVPQTARIADPGAFWNAIMALGRNSLLIYLIHQPILFGIFMLIAQLN